MDCRGDFFEYLCGMKNKSIIVLALLAACFLQSCRDVIENPNYPNAYINFTINLNQTEYADLRHVSGFAYVTSDLLSTSRGIIIYRLYQDEFRAYDRLPPNYHNACTDSQGNTNRLVVEGGFWVVDHCNNAYYNIINGDIFIDNDTMVPNFDCSVVYPLIQYHTVFDGTTLRVYN